MEELRLEEPAPGTYQLYLASSSAPLTSLVFTLPLFIVYHLGLWWLNTFAGLHWANAVDIAIANGLARLGVAGPFLSFSLVIVVFLILHAVSGKPARWPPLHAWFFMLMESLILALPVFMLSRLAVKLSDYLGVMSLSAAAGDAALSWQANLVLSCGAGVYEEFFFRVILMGAAVIFLGGIIRMKSGWKYVLAGMFQAIIFAASHHLPGGPEEVTSLTQAKLAVPAFIFRVAAGIYFAFIYVERGFGIAAGSHAGYDLMVVLLDMLAPMER
ncbi:MAG: CPBP family intramembrane metalloprotease [Planctomycetota bacterium]|nr:CPBP family intramembrane metalloprotease [Planctomycetota bacterium]